MTRRATKFSCEFVDCTVCKQPMNAIFDEKIRDTCTTCGGHAIPLYPDVSDDPALALAASIIAVDEGDGDPAA